MDIEFIDKLKIFINKLDPLEMMIYNDKDIYQKECKLIAMNKLLISEGKIREIFKLSFFKDIDYESCTKIKDFVINNRGTVYSYQYFNLDKNTKENK